MAIEIKASERAGKRIGLGEIVADLKKLQAHREEVEHRHKRRISTVMMIVDTAPLPAERMLSSSLADARSLAADMKIVFCYVSADMEILDVPSVG